MKSIRMILPVIAFLFAIGAALTSVSATTNALDTVDVSYVKTTACDVIGECTFTGQNPPLCKDGNIQLFEYISSSSCPTMAHGTFDPE